MILDPTIKNEANPRSAFPAIERASDGLCQASVSAPSHTLYVRRGAPASERLEVLMLDTMLM